MSQLPSLKFSSLKPLLSKLMKNVGWLFFAAFLLLLAMEIFEIKKSSDIILNVNQEPPGVIKEKGVRIDFGSYNAIVQRIQQAQNYQPTGGISKNPFATGVSQTGK